MSELHWLWLIIGIYILHDIYLATTLYRLGKYVKKHYPTRYINQLSTSNSLYKNRSFPFNSSLTGDARYGGYGVQFQKIADIAKAENDNELLKKLL